MTIKWNKNAVKSLIAAITFIEENGYEDYAEKLEHHILSLIKNLPKTHLQYPLDRFREANDGSYRALTVDDYRISFRVKPDQIQIIRIRHGSRKPRFYKR